MNSAIETQSTERRSGYVLWPLLAGAAVYLYCNLFLLFGTPILQSDDQVYFWMHAQRMLSGERPYIDFFQYTPPGTDLVFLALFELFGPRIWVVNVAVLLLGVALCWTCFSIARQILGLRVAIVTAVFYLVFIFGKPLNATHHWFSTLLVMCAVAAVLAERNRRRIAAAGMLLGTAAFFTQTHGIAALVAFTMFLTWEHIEKNAPRPELLTRLGLLGLSFLASALVLSSYFIAIVGVKRLWYEQVTYVHSYAVQGFSTPNLGLPASLAWHNLLIVGQQLFVYALLPCACVAALFMARTKASTSEQPQRIILLSLAGLLLFLEVAMSPNWLRIYAVSMPGIIVAFWLGVRKSDRATAARRYALPLICAGVACLAAVQLVSRHRRAYVTLELPGGTVAVPAPQSEEIDWIATHTKPGEFFFQAAWPGLYIPLALRNPLFLDAAGTNEQTRPEDVDLAIRQLDQKEVRYILWSQRLDSIPLGHPEQDHLGPLRGYLRERYTLIKTFAGTPDEVWRRKIPENP
jgi:hypothetical protein